MRAAFPTSSPGINGAALSFGNRTSDLRAVAFAQCNAETILHFDAQINTHGICYSASGDANSGWTNGFADGATRHATGSDSRAEALIASNSARSYFHGNSSP